MAQTADIGGRNNTIIQIVGDGNTVVPGHAHLTLTRYLNLRKDVRSDADRLSPYARWIPLVGRRGELRDLHAWLDLDKQISVRVLTGRAGSPGTDRGGAGRLGCRFRPGSRAATLPL